MVVENCAAGDTAVRSVFRRGELTHMGIVPEYHGRLPGKSNNLLVKLFGGKDT